MTVSQVLQIRSAAFLAREPQANESIAMGGYWSAALLAISCAPPFGKPGALEMYCQDGLTGITELPESILAVDAFGNQLRARSAHLTPFLPAELTEAAMLGRQRGPMPIVVVGHFDDPRAAQCRPEALQLCRDRLIVDRVDSFGDPAAIPLAGTPVPLPPLSVSNETAFNVAVLVNGVLVATLLPGERPDPLRVPLPPLPWVIETRSESGQVLSTLTIKPEDPIDATNGRGVRVDLACGRLDVWSGPPLLGPTFSPGPFSCG